MRVIVISIQELISATDCPESQRSCCYDLDIDLDSLAVSCVNPDQVEVAQKTEKNNPIFFLNLRRKNLWLLGVKKRSIRTPAG